MPLPIQKEDLINSTNGGLDIFKHYICSDFPLKKAFNSPLREESKPSFSIFEKSGVYYFKDQGTDEKGDALAYVMLSQNVDFKTAIERVASDMQLSAIKKAEKAVKKEKVTITEVSDQITLFPSAKNKNPESTLKDIWDFMYKVKSLFWGRILDNYRAVLIEDKEKAKVEKLKLPAISYAGNFSRCEDKSMLSKSNIIIIDIDNKKGSLNIDSIKQNLKKHTFIAGFFESPSLGLKVVCKADFPAHEVEYPVFYEKACTWISAKTKIPLATRLADKSWTDGIDPVNKNLSRLCFVSSDPQAFINKDAQPLPENLDKLEEEEEGLLPIFWKQGFKSGKACLEVDRTEYLYFLQSQGFCVRHVSGEEYQFLQIIDNIIYERTTKEMKTFVLNYVMDFPTDMLSDYEDEYGEKLFWLEWKNRNLIDMVLGSKILFDKNGLMFLDEGKLDMKRDTRHEQFQFYQNCWVRTTAKGKTVHNYDQLDKLIFKKQIINRNFKLMPDAEVRKFDYRNFIYNISGKHTERYESALSMIGYLLHRYKDQAYYKFVLLMDEMAEVGGKRKGRTGKGRLEDALFYMKNTDMCYNIALHISGSDMDESYQFKFQDATDETELIKLEDMKEGFQLDTLIVEISGGMLIKKKGTGGLMLKYADSPKLFGSTNFMMLDDSASMADRIFEFEFSDHYNLEHRPIDDFNKYFFTGWDANDWALFDNFMLNCVSFFLQSGGKIKTYTKDNIKHKRFNANLREKFRYKYKELDMGILINHLYGVKTQETYAIKTLFEEFLADEPSYKDAAFSQRAFTECVQLFADFKGLMVIKSNTRSIQLVGKEEEEGKLTERISDFVDGLKPNTYYLRELKNMFDTSYPADVPISKFEKALSDRATFDQQYPHKMKVQLYFVDDSHSKLRIEESDPNYDTNPSLADETD